MTHLCTYLIRHGQTDWNVEKRLQGSSNIPLNEHGKRQAEAAAKKLATAPLTAVYSSPLTRTLQTAEIIAQPHKLKPVIIQELTERNHGKWEGLTEQERNEKYPNHKEEQNKLGIDWHPPEGESYREVSERAITTFKEIMKKHTLGQHIVIVSHGGVLRTIIHWLHGGKPEDIFNPTAFHIGTLDNTELVEVHWNEKAKKIVRSIEHLNELNT